MNTRHNRKNIQNRTGRRKTNNEDVNELQKNSRFIKETIKNGFKKESSLAEIETALNSMIEVSIVLARHLETKQVIKSLLGAIRILLNRPEPDRLQDDLLD